MNPALEDKEGDKPKEEKEDLPVQDGSIPEYLASLRKEFDSWPVIGNGTPIDEMHRIKPGELKLKKPNSVVELYE